MLNLPSFLTIKRSQERKTWVQKNLLCGSRVMAGTGMAGREERGAEEGVNAGGYGWRGSTTEQASEETTPPRRWKMRASIENPSTGLMTDGGGRSGTAIQRKTRWDKIHNNTISTIKGKKVFKNIWVRLSIRHYVDTSDISMLLKYQSDISICYWNITLLPSGRRVFTWLCDCEWRAKRNWQEEEPQYILQADYSLMHYTGLSTGERESERQNERGRERDRKKCKGKKGNSDVLRDQ